MSNISIRLGIQTASFKSGLHEARRDVDRFKSEMARGGGLMGGLVAGIGKLGGIFAGGAIVAGTKQLLDSAGEMRDAAEALGLSAEQLARTQEAFAGSGSDPAKTAQGMMELSTSISSALREAGPAREAFDRLGVSVDDLVRHATEPHVILFKMADGFKAARDRGQALEDVQALLGRSGKRMASGMAEGGAALRDAYRGAAVASDEAISHLDKLGDAIDGFFRKAKNTGLSILAGLTGGGKRWTLENEQSVTVTHKADPAAAARKAALDNDRELAARGAREKDAARQMKAEGDLLATREKIGVGLGGRKAAENLTRRKLAELAPLAVGPGADAAERRAEMAGLMGERLDQIRSRLAMTPDERRAELRAGIRSRSLTRRAEAKLRQEMVGDLRTNLQGTDRSPENMANAIKEQKAVLDGILIEIKNIKGEMGWIN